MNIQTLLELLKTGGYGKKKPEASPENIEKAKVVYANNMERKAKLRSTPAGKFIHKFLNRAVSGGLASTHGELAYDYYASAGAFQSKLAAFPKFDDTMLGIMAKRCPVPASLAADPTVLEFFAGIKECDSLVLFQQEHTPRKAALKRHIFEWFFIGSEFHPGKPTTSHPGAGDTSDMSAEKIAASGKLTLAIFDRIAPSILRAYGL